MDRPTSMTVIKSVESFETSGNVAHIATYESLPSRTLDGPLSNPAFATEVIYGRIFTDKNGDSRMIGLSEAASEALGLPFEVIINLEEDLRDKCRTINHCSSEVVRYHDLVKLLEDRVNELRRSNLWARLKFLFTREI